MSVPAVKPSTSTLRVVEWDELPESVRQIPSDYNPVALGLLMEHQTDWLAIQAQIKLCEKGRRTGITFAEALDSVITSASRRSAGGMDCFYIGDTKEKGLEFIGYCAKFSRTIAEAQAAGASEIEEFLFEDQDEHGNTRQINAYRIRYASGFKIVALSSNPANIRGLQGKVIIDEAAFHRDVSAVLDAATALLIWGGRIVIISTHNGRGNPFNQMINDIREGRYGEDAVVYRATFDDAVANGLYERMCFMTSQAPTPEGKETWYKRIRNAYGPRRAQMREELDAIPRDGNGICIPGVWIEDAMVADRPVLRLALDDDFALQSVPRREAYVDEWIERHLAPIMRGLSADLRHYAGQDYARHRDFSIIVPMAITQDRLRDVPFVVEMNKVPRRQQQQILWYILRRLPRFCAAALDATGNGEALAEDTADEFGHGRIHQVKLSRTWYGTWMPRFVDLFQDGAILMPKDDALGQDIRAIEQVDGIPMIAKARQQDLKDPELYRHGDFAGAGALALFATLDSPSGPVKARSRRRRSGAQLTRGYA
ncbi:hypothetical protein D9M71_62770 [compost metagenome]